MPNVRVYKQYRGVGKHLGRVNFRTHIVATSKAEALQIAKTWKPDIQWEIHPLLTHPELIGWERVEA